IMTISIFDLFSIGIGPSSSHTVGPMKAAKSFITLLNKNNQLLQTTRLTIELFGSLAFTGKGHGTDRAILSGLAGYQPDTVDPDSILPRAERIIHEQKIPLATGQILHFDYQHDFIFNYKELLEAHTNGMRFTAYANDQPITFMNYYSIGGGFILDEQQASH